MRAPSRLALVAGSTALVFGLASCADSRVTTVAQLSPAKSPTSGLPEPVRPAVPRPAGYAGNLRVLDWAGFQGAVSYSLDDSQPSHVEHYAELQATGIPMTFYVNAGTAKDALATWRQALADGHEIANHTTDHCHVDPGAPPTLSGCLFGPDQPNPPPGATPGSEIDDNTAWISAQLGAPGVWTMATPFGDSDWDDFARPRFLLNRAVFQGMIAPGDATDPFHLPCYMAGATQDGGIDDQPATFDGLIDQARAEDKWMIFLFHSILPTAANWYGGVDIASITASTDHVKSLGDVWADTVVNVGAYWRAQTMFAAITPESCANGIVTWRWSLPANFPPGKFLRVTVDGGTLMQAGEPLPWNDHGYYEVALDKGTLSLVP